MNGPRSAAVEIQGLLALFGVTPAGAVAKLESTIANTQRQLDEIDTKRQPLIDLLHASLRQLALFRGEADTEPPQASAEPKTPAVRTPAPVARKAESATPLGGVPDWDPLTLKPRYQRGPLPQSPVSVHEFASEKIARERLRGYRNVGYVYSTGRPLRPGELDFTSNRHGYYLLVRPLHAAEEVAS